MCFKSDDLYYIRKSSHSTDLSKRCLLTYGNKIIPVAGLTFVCGSHMLWETGTAWSLSCLQSETSSNDKITMLWSERGFSVLKCGARQLWRGSTWIKKRRLQLGGSWEPRTKVFGGGQHVCVHQHASSWKSNRHPLPLILIHSHQKRRENLGRGSIWQLPKECNNPNCGVRALQDRTLALAPALAASFPPTRARSRR